MVQPLGRYTLKLHTTPAAGFTMPGLAAAADSIIAITDDRTGIAPLVKAGLALHGIRSNVVETVPKDAKGVLFLGGLRDMASDSDAAAVNQDAFAAAKAVSLRLAAEGGLFVTVQNTGGTFGLAGMEEHRAWSGGLAGLAKTAALEWPETSVKAIDLELAGRTAQQAADALVRELLEGGPELEVGLKADGRRLTVAAELSSLTREKRLIERGAVIVVSGGARGVTASALQALAEAAAPRFALLGRTALAEEPACCAGAVTDAELKRALLEQGKAEGKKVSPADLTREVQAIRAVREIRATLLSLEKAGSEAVYLAVDIQDGEELNHALGNVRRMWGPIAGLIHGAGVLADKKITDKTPEQFNRVFRTKVNGLQALLEATKEDPLSMIVMFSSIAARTGNIGQCDYAMANEVLNKVAAEQARQRGDRCIVKSFNWGPWDGGMVTAGLRDHFDRMGVSLIPVRDGARIFVEELFYGRRDEVEVVITGKPDAGGIMGSAYEPNWTMDIGVDARRYPFLKDHTIQGTAVVPVVIVLDWMMKAAQACRPDRTVLSIDGLQVLKGILLDSFQKGALHRFRLHVRQGASGSPEADMLRVELTGADGLRHYTAAVRLAEKAGEYGLPSLPRNEPAAEPPGLDAAIDEKWSAIYERHLFHGPAFQAVVALKGLSGSGAGAMLKRTADMNWGPSFASHKLTDPAMLDGGLQLAILWGVHQSGEKSVPTRIGRYIPFQEAVSQKGANGTQTDPVVCLLKAIKTDLYKTVSDIWFYTPDGAPLGGMTGVEMHTYGQRDENSSAVEGNIQI